MDLSIRTSTDLLKPEVVFASTREGYKLLSEISIKENESVNIPLEESNRKVYTVSLENFIISFKAETTGLLDLSISGNSFLIKGDLKALEHLSDYFKFMSESENSFHWHIDYYEGNHDVLETNISLVLQVK